MDNNKIYDIVPDYFIYKIALVGKDDKKYGEGVHRACRCIYRFENKINMA